jgi:hypothetical protein
MTLTDSEWRTITKLIETAGRASLKMEWLAEAAEAAYLVRVEAETRDRRATERETSSPIHPADLPPGSASAPEKT